MLRLCDSHCHLDFAPWGSGERNLGQDLTAWQAQGIERFVVPAIGQENWDAVAALAQQYPAIYFALGVHPAWAQRQPETALAELRQCLSERNSKCVAIGECGLDGRSHIEQAGQEAWLVAQLKLAQEFELPLLLHSVRANDTLYKWLRRYPVAAGGVIHAFSGSLQQAERFWALGFRLGVGGIITQPRAEKSRAALVQMPIEALLLETDAPDMAPHGWPQTHNSPAALGQILEELAQLKGVSPLEAALKLTQNAKQLFKW